MKGIFKNKSRKDSVGTVSQDASPPSSPSEEHTPSSSNNSNKKLSVRNIFKKNKDKSSNRLSTSTGLSPLSDCDTHSDGTAVPNSPSSASSTDAHHNHHHLHNDTTQATATHDTNSDPASPRTTIGTSGNSVNSTSSGNLTGGAAAVNNGINHSDAIKMNVPHVDPFEIEVMCQPMNIHQTFASWNETSPSTSTSTSTLNNTTATPLPPVSEPVDGGAATIQAKLSSSSLSSGGGGSQHQSASSSQHQDDNNNNSNSNNNNNAVNNTVNNGTNNDKTDQDLHDEGDDPLVDNATHNTTFDDEDSDRRVIHLPAAKPSDQRKWVSRIIEFVADVEDGQVHDLCNVCSVNALWYSVGATDKFWKPLVEYQMRERALYSDSSRRSYRSKYLAMVNRQYETTEPPSDDETDDNRRVRVHGGSSGSSKRGRSLTVHKKKNGEEGGTTGAGDNGSNDKNVNGNAGENSESGDATPDVSVSSTVNGGGADNNGGATSPTSTTPSSPTSMHSASSSSVTKAVAPLEPVDPAPYYATDFRAITYKEDPEENIEWAMEDGKNQIECASLNKLVEMLTHTKEYDIFFMQTFILTFRSFTDQKTLIDKLIERFNMPPPRPDISPEDFAIFKKENLDKVRLRVTSTLKYWMESFFVFDFSDAEMLKRMRELIEMMEQSNSGALANMLKRTLDKMQSDSEGAGRVRAEVKCPDILKPKKSFFGKKKASCILDYPLLEVARQLTLIDFEVFAKIEPKECLNQSWNKEYRVTKAPNINEMIQSFNKLSNWVGTEIVQVVDLEKRVQVMEKMIELANHCKELNNFNATFSVVSGLNLASIYRLKNSWTAISDEHRQMYEELNKYISRDFNFRFIRAAVKNVKPPCIPYIGLYLTDLTFIEEGNPKYLKQKINFVRCRRFAEVIRDMQTYQNTRYALLPYPELQELLKGITYLGEEEMYQQSLVVEARQKTNKKKKPAA